MDDSFDRLASRAATAVREVARSTADPDGDLAAVLGEPVTHSSGGRTRGRWMMAAAAALVAVAVAAVVVVVAGGDPDDGRIVPATLPPTPTVPATTVPGATVPATTVPATSVQPATAPSTTAPATTIAPTTMPGSTTTSVFDVPAGESLLDVLRPCAGTDCQDVAYGAGGSTVVYDPEARTLTTLGAGSIPLDIPETAGRLVAVGPEDVAYLVVETTVEPYPGRLLAVPTTGDRAGSVTDLTGPVDGLGFAGIGPTATGIEVVDCCGVGVPDGSYPYIDATGAQLPGDPTLARWSWTWTDVVTVADAETGRTFQVPQRQAEREGPRDGDLRRLLDGRVPVLVDDAEANTTVWVFDPPTESWASTELGFVNVVAVDPAGAVLVRDRSTLNASIVPLN